MPPKKRSKKSVTVSLDELSLAILEILIEQCGGSFASRIRQAIAYYAQFSDEVDWSELEARVLGYMQAAEHDSGEAIELRDSVVQLLQKNYAPAIPSFGETADEIPDTLSDFASTASDFELKEQ